MSRDMYQTLSERINELEAQVRTLEERQRLLLQLVDEKRDPLTYFQLYYGLYHDEISAMLEIMEEARTAIEQGIPIEAHGLESRLLQLFGRLNKNYQFVKVIFDTVADSRQYPDLYEYYRIDLNLGPARNNS